MSFIGSLVNSLLSDEGSSQPKPCSNCPGNCSVFPKACAECKDYKEKLINLLYDVEHLDAHYAKYEVVGTVTAPVGNTACPCCGAPNPAGSAVCEYCGSQIGQSSSKIQVASASQIPDPIQLAQDVIFARHEVEKKYASPDSSNLLGSLVSMVTGTPDNFGSRMTTEEIKATAQAYGVSVAAYLSGLDCGTYLTASARAREAQVRAASYAIPGAAATAFGAARMMRQEPPFRGRDSRPESPFGHSREREMGRGMQESNRERRTPSAQSGPRSQPMQRREAPERPSRRQESSNNTNNVASSSGPIGGHSPKSKNGR